jgi:SPP1 family predicted phage head-tail adaptor
MRAGQLDRRVTLQSRTTVKSATTGAVSEVFTDLVTVWAQRTDLRGREYFAAQQINADVTAKFRIRWRSGITELHRIVDGTTTFDIANVAEIGRREGLEILATAKTS